VVNILEQVGLTCVMVTHDQQEAMTMASRIAVMSQGSFLQIGTPSEIYETPNCRFVADFIGDCNMFEGTLIVDEPDHVVIETPECKHYVGHGITGTLGMAVGVAVRPEKISVLRERPSGEFNFCEAEVIDLAYLGSYTVYYLKFASGKKIKASAPNVDRHQEGAQTWGDKVFATWSQSAMVVLTN
ncbi:MAG: TOBE domain-containing protein, partial [Burkholderiales bacterium]